MPYYNEQECYRGDIFYITDSKYCVGSEQKGGRPGIIVSNDKANKSSPNVEIVYLTSQEKKPLPTHVDVICKVPSTALCENIQTVSKERLGAFIKSCTTKELKNIDEALAISLGLSFPENPEKSVEPSKESPVSLTAIDPSAAEIERNLYKLLYEQLLDRLTVKASA